MRVINARNVHSALPEALDLMYHRSVKRDSRNGAVYVVPGPVATVYSYPAERVIFHPWRDANPFFHFYESLWMLAGRNDIAPLARYVKRMAAYSDNGETQNAAYGHRWRHAPLFEPHWGGPVGGEEDQLDEIINGLHADKDCRRQVLQIWDHDRDLGTKTKDAACNIAATFQISHEGRLDMSVFCRSNDIIWGCYGANAVHFSVLMEYIATSIDVPMGEYTQISVNWHAYEDIFKKMHASKGERYVRGVPITPYDEVVSTDVGCFNENTERVKPYPLMSVPRAKWDHECKLFCEGAVPGSLPRGRQNMFDDPFFRHVAWPIVLAHDIYKDRDRPKDYFVQIYDTLADCAATDWRLACTQWMQRRQQEALK